MTLNHPRLYHTLRARFEAAEKQKDRGNTAAASDLNQLTITESLIEILAALENIASSLQIIAGETKGPAGSPKPAQQQKAK